MSIWTAAPVADDLHKVFIGIVVAEPRTPLSKWSLCNVRRGN